MADKTLHIETEEGKYGMVHTVSYRSDNEPTVVNMAKTMSEIKKQDPKFYAQTAEVLRRANGSTFSFGDKYFMPITQDNMMLCIPLKVRNWDKVTLKNNFFNKMSAQVARKDELKLRKKMEKSGYFDVSDFVIQ